MDSDIMMTEWRVNPCEMEDSDRTLKTTRNCWACATILVRKLSTINVLNKIEQQGENETQRRTISQVIWRYLGLDPKSLKFQIAEI
jgi:hypothetical protein